jgi:ATP-binding protein involved in chromosome partitioning
MADESSVRSALSTVKYPGFSRDIVSFGLIKEIRIEGDRVDVRMSFATRDPKVPEQIYREARAVLEAIPGIEEVHIEFDLKEPPAAPAAGGESLASRIPGVKHVIAVASGKGGVGKSTVSANLAVALAATGKRVGLCDCDLYGPSMALMFGTDEQPQADQQDRIIPIRKHGIQLMSMGLLVQDDSAVIVRGPLATRYIQQLLRQVAWDNLDYLILDLPPGTGDIQLTIVQTVALDGAVLVTTPQEVALIDARKAATMFAKVNVPVLGIVENMSYFLCPNDGNRYDIFGTGGGAVEAKRLGVPLLGEVPLDIPTRRAGDEGTPIAASRGAASSPAATVFHEVARKIDTIVGARK